MQEVAGTSVTMQDPIATPTFQSRGSSSKLDDMLHKQYVHFKAFIRTVQNIDLDIMTDKWEFEDALQTLQTRWTAIDNLHWDIIGESEENLAYETHFSKHEQTFISMKKAINSKMWSTSHREKSTPKLDIPTFTGHYQQWVSFKDLFNEAIHKNNSLSNAQKMQFLKSKVKGEAERLIQHLPISSDNYIVCWEILNHRFDNKRLIFTSHVNVFLNLPTIQQQTFLAIKKLHDVTLENLHAIKNLGIDTSTWDPLLVHILSQKLDGETYSEYIESLNDSRALPILKEFLDFLENKFTSLETARRRQDVMPKISQPSSQQHGSSTTNNISRKYNYYQSGNNWKTTRPVAKSLHVSAIKCLLCGKQHALFSCAKFLSMPNNIKLNTIHKMKLCKNCLFNHNGQQCISVKRCQKCGGNHHSVLHDACTQNMTQSNNAVITTTDPNDQAGDVSITANLSQNHPGPNEVLLATALVKVAAIDGSYHVLRALIDPGSQVSLITERAANRLGLSRSKFNGLILGVGEVETNCKGVSTLRCTSTHNDYTFVTDVLVMSKILKDIPSKSFETANWSYIDNLKLADPKFNVSRPADLLLSAQVNGMIMLGGLIKGESLSQPVLQETQLGWIIYGGGKVTSLQCNVILNNMQDIQRFWEIEDISDDSKLSSEDQECVNFYLSTTKRRQDGRYEVRLPLKPDITEHLGSSKEMAIAQFRTLERKFSKQPILAEQYKEFMSEYVALGHMVPSYKNNKQALSCYLPHHSVHRAESATTKLRVVFNASARTSSGISVNDLMYKGPNLQHDLLELILKWRQYRYAYTSDIEKMYRQIAVNEADQQYQRIIWRDAPEKALQTYNLTTVTYGTKSAPFIAMMTLKQLASDERIHFPEAAKVLEGSFYMDDLVHGSHSIEMGQRLIKDLNNLLKSGGFTLRKWSTNHPELLRDIEPSSSNSEAIFSFKSESTAKTLGLRWNARDDKLTFHFILANQDAKITKRMLLSDISKVFDPLGWLSPVTTKLKLIFQKLWMEKMQWDEEIPDSIKKEWVTIRTDMKYLNQCEIPRWIGYQPNETLELHGYCDASNKAYAAVIYARIRRNSHTSVVLVVSKTRLVPLTKSISLPRLELSGAYLLAKLMNKVTSCLSELDVRRYGWTDSMVVLGWLQGEPSRWKPFVANRTKFITEIIKPSYWRYIKSEDNPADAASRGISASQLVHHSLWWQGPQALQSFDENLESKRIIYTTDHELKTKSTPSKVNSVQNNSEESIISQLLLRFSSYSKIIKIIAWMLRAINKMKLKNSVTGLSKNNDTPEFLTLNELRKAQLLIIKYIQQTEFTEDIQSLQHNKKLSSKSNLLKLNPFIDNEGVLRVGGRLSKANICMDMKHPAILPHSGRLTTLIIQQAHLFTFHGGPRVTLFNLRQKYWIIGGNKAIRKEVRNCVICRKHEPKMQHQLMGEIPASRSNPAPAFYSCGVDYSGYLDVKSSKGRGVKTTKGYIALFICMATKAVHLELVSDLSSSAFLAALRRMAARRGAPRHLYSDNGTNFVGANRMIQESYHDFKSIYDNTFFAELNKLKIEWHFNAPSWPSAGGLWERAIRSLKHHLRRVVGEQRLTFEEYSTILAQLEACLNSRPLCPLSEDVDDLNILSPAHFLIGRCGTGIIETQEDARTRWHLSARLVNDIWKKWKTEYLTQLSVRGKWRNNQQNLSIGDLVTIQDDNLPPGQWLMGRVVEIHPGQDQLVRVVTLKTKNGYLKRPVTKLSILPIPKESSNTQTQQSKPSTVRSNNSYRVHNRPKIFSIALSLLFFMSTLLTTKASYTFTTFNDSKALYFDPLGKMHLIRDDWKMITYYNMSPYWEANKAVTEYSKYLEVTCSKIKEPSHCQIIMLQIQHAYGELKYYNTLLLNQHFGTRSRMRRGLINAVGSVANTLFGVLDQEFAEKYQHDIDLVRSNTNHLYQLYKNQTSVLEAEYNILKRTEETIERQRKIINKHLNYLDNVTNRLQKEIDVMSLQQEFTLAALATVNIIHNLKGIQDTFLDTMTDIYHGQINLHLLMPDQLKAELQIVSSRLSKEIALPVEDIQSNLHKIYKLLRIKARVTKEYFIFEITIPLISRDTFQLYHLIPVPTQVNNSMIHIQPVSEYVAINLRRNVYVSASINDLQSCESQEETYLCRLQGPIKNLDADERFCIKERLTCSFTKTACENRWIPLHDYSTYLYFCCDSYSLRVMCDDEIQNYQLSKAGLIRLTKQCIVKGRDVTLYAYQHLENTLHLKPDIIDTQLSSIHHMVNSNSLPIPNFDGMNNDIHINESLKQLGDQIRRMKESAQPTEILTTHDVHHYVLSYGLLAAAIVAFLWFLRWRRRRAASPARQHQLDSVDNSVCTNQCAQSLSVSARVHAQAERAASVSARKQPCVEQGPNVCNSADRYKFAKRWSSLRVGKRDKSTSPIVKRQSVFTVENSIV